MGNDLYSIRSQEVLENLTLTLMTSDGWIEHRCLEKAMVVVSANLRRKGGGCSDVDGLRNNKKKERKKEEDGSDRKDMG